MGPPPLIRLCLLLTLLTVVQLGRLVNADHPQQQQQHPFAEFIQDKTHRAFSGHDNAVEIADRLGEALNHVRNNYVDLLDLDGMASTVWDTNVSSDCSNDIMLIAENIRQKQLWAINFVDAASKPEAGILQGNFVWLGSFSQCQAAKAVQNNDTQFQGKYCLANIGPALNASQPPPAQNPEGPSVTLALKLGVCFPDSCSDQDTFQLMSNLLTMLTERTNVTTGIQVYGSNCQPRTIPYDTQSIIALAVIGIFLFIIALGTLYDIVVYQPRLAELLQNGSVPGKHLVPGTLHSASYPVIGTDHSGGSNGFAAVDVNERCEVVYSDDDDAPLLADSRELPVKERTHHHHPAKHAAKPEIGILGEILMVFSIYTNTQKLLSVSSNDQSLTCIHGIRFLSMTWVVLGHTYGFSIYIVRDLTTLPNILGNFWFQAIANATVSVDTFFTMSGLLVCYLFVLNYKKVQKLHVVGYYVHRYWRLTAAYAVVMFIYLSLFKYLGSGPQWNPNGMEIDGCRGTWWTNLLYINNLLYTDKQCMGWTWYLANDMQFYWISPLILFPLVKKPVVGLVMLGVIFVAHIVTTAVISVQYDFPPSMLGNGITSTGNGSSTGSTANLGASMWDYFNRYYTKPWTRIGPYLIGMLTGYLLVIYKEEKLKIRKEVVFGLWAVSAAMALAVLYGLYDVNNGHSLTSAGSAIYNTLSRNGWALAVCWLIFACVQGYGGFVNTLLSWNVLVPLSRVTYCCYLIHIPIMLIFYLSKTTNVDFSHLAVVYYFFGTIMITYGFAFLFTVGCESPLLGLEKLVNRKKGTKRAD
ncbi:Nose resistant to fluoxetine protein 6 [Hypsibius exemplaris]|uniref:Nose resistant to fluoxetine protein 6 n=1 Tax=Hypsibius exemplaris TaxID=2072580 RepID=A0A1W0X105_HYPEX|nr:Nose resistant to fluoxetine protein 6 [Hypsibius exemplaris]